MNAMSPRSTGRVGRWGHWYPRPGACTLRGIALMGAMVAGLVACGDDDGGDSMGEVDAAIDANIGDGAAPSASVIFPPPLSLTDDDTIIVRGTASDPDGVAEVLVNGVVASSDDGFATWQAELNLSHGSNRIDVATRDALDFEDEEAAQLRVILSANWMRTPRAIAIDAAQGRALVMDSILDALLAIDLDTGERTILSSDDVGLGPEFSEPVSVVVDTAGSRVLVLDENLAAVLAVDVASGNRTVLADADEGAGDDFAGPVAMVLDSANERLLVLDIDNSPAPDPARVALYAVALSNGDRTLIADADTGEGPDLAQPTAMVLDGERQLVFIADVDASGPTPVPVIYRLTLGDGNREVLADTTDSTAVIDEPVGLALDDNGGAPRVLVLDAGQDAVIAVAESDGARTVVSQDQLTGGEELSLPTAVALGQVDGEVRALVTDRGLDAVVAVDLDDGTRSVLSGTFVGEGERFRVPVALAFDALTGSLGRAIVLDNQNDAVMVVDLATGNRELASDDDRGAGEALQTPIAVDLSVAAGLQGQSSVAGTVLVVDASTDTVLEISLASGDRQVVSAAERGSGDPLDQPVAVVLQPGVADGGGNRALVVDSGDPTQIVAIDLASGDRSLVSGPDSAGVELGNPVGAALDFADGDRLLVVSESPAALIGVKLSDGERTNILTQVNRPTDVISELALAPPAGDGGDIDGGVPDKYVATGRALISHRNSSSDGEILAVGVADGMFKQISGDSEGRGPDLDDPVGLQQDPQSGMIWVIDDGLNALFAVDAVSGDRVVVSR